jgi:uncharacterized membrane protein
MRHEFHRTLVAARRYFVAGLAIVLPTFLTVYILWFLFSLLNAMLAPFIHTALRLFLGRETVALLATPVTVLIGAGFVWLVGFTGAAFSRRFFERTEAAFGQIPFVRGIYQTVRQILDMFFRKDGSFQQVALIEYPRPGLYCICFITNPKRWRLPGTVERRGVPVFIPTTPNPTSGFFLLVPEEQVVALDMSVEDAVRVIVSGGIAAPAGLGLTGTILRETTDTGPR